MDFIRANLSKLQQELKKICLKNKRTFESITLVAVSKTFFKEHILAAYDYGHRIFGENRPQELRDKMDEIQVADIRWHLIGALQPNKIKYVAGKTDLIHSVDSVSLGEAIDHYCHKHEITQKILIEVNASGESSKLGIYPDSLKDMLQKFALLKHLQVCGLMTMAPLTSQVKLIKNCFMTLRQLRDEYQKSFPTLEHLSMGMSNDYAIALEEGATILRIGTAIFGERTAIKTFHE